MAMESTFFPNTIDQTRLQQIVQEVLPKGYTAYAVRDRVTYTPDPFSVKVTLYHRPAAELRELLTTIQDRVKGELGLDCFTSDNLYALDMAERAEYQRQTIETDE